MRPCVQRMRLDHEQNGHTTHPVDVVVPRGSCGELGDVLVMESYCATRLRELKMPLMISQPSGSMTSM